MHTPVIPEEIGHMLPSNGNNSNAEVNIATTTTTAAATATLGSWHLWCRLCAKEDPQGNINVYFKDEQQTTHFGSNNLNGDLSLIAAIEKYFFVEISRNNELPKMLCTECFSLVTALVNFSERVTKVQQMFCKIESATDEMDLDLHAVRLKFGLLDEDREHVLMPQALPEVHYFEAKPKINELEEKIFEAESALVTLTNPLEQQPRIRIKIKKENITEDARQQQQQQQQRTVGEDEDEGEFEAEATSTMDEDPCEENGDNDIDGDVADEEDPFNEAADMDFKPALSRLQTASDESNSDNDREDESVERKFADIKQELTHLQKSTTKKRHSTRQHKRHTRRQRCETKAAKEELAAEDDEVYKEDGEASDDSDYNENGDTTTKSARTKRRHKSNNDIEEDLPADVAADSLYECSECPQRFKLVRFYRQHMKRVHSMQPALPELRCEQCMRVFNTQDQLKRHVKVHLPAHLRNVLPCEYCDKKFSSTTQVKSHVKHVHLDERQFVCEECGITQRTNSALRAHMLTHTDYAPFECQVCKKRFKNKPRLRNHMETHNPHKHICAECGLQLNSRPTLNRHLLVHSDQMQHKCDYCGRAFKRAKALKNHLILHTGLKPYSCDFCDRTFANGSNCRTHKKKSHPEELAALEAAGGGKTYNRNIPKLAALKAVTRAADNLAPVVSKQSGRFAFGKKPKPLTQTSPSKQQLNQRARSDNKHLNVAAGVGTTNGSGSGSGNGGADGADDDRSATTASKLEVNTLPTTVAGIPTIDNIYSHIMKQAHIVATQADTEQHGLISTGTPTIGLHLKRPPSAASSIGVSSATIEQDMQMPVDASVAHLQQLQQQRQRQQQLLLQQQQQQQPTTSNNEQQFYAEIIKQQQQQQQQQQRHHLLTPDDIASIHSPDSQASNATTVTNINNNSTQQQQQQQLPDDQHSNASNAHFYAQIRQQQSNLQGSYI